VDSAYAKLISDLVSEVGTAAFEHRFYEQCRAMFHNQQCNVFVLQAGRAAECLLTYADDRAIRLLTERCAARYLTDGVPSDPILREVRSSGEPPSGALVRMLSPRQINDRTYRRRFYENAAVRHKLAAMAQIDGRFIYLNFYRDPDQADFADAEWRRLGDIAQVLCALLARHHRMTEAERAATTPRSVMPEAFRARMFSRIRQALLMEDAGLTAKEADICASIALGRTAAGIALDYGISPNTVATHRKRAYAKLGIGSQSELFARYYESLTNQVLNTTRTN